GGIGNLRCNFLLGYSANAGDWHQDGAWREGRRRSAPRVGPIHAIDDCRCRARTCWRVRVDAADDEFVVWCHSDGYHDGCFSLDWSIARRVSCLFDSGETSNASRPVSSAAIRVTFENYAGGVTGEV